MLRSRIVLPSSGPVLAEDRRPAELRAFRCRSQVAPDVLAEEYRSASSTQFWWQRRRPKRQRRRWKDRRSLWRKLRAVICRNLSLWRKEFSPRFQLRQWRKLRGGGWGEPTLSQSQLWEKVFDSYIQRGNLGHSANLLNVYGESRPTTHIYSPSRNIPIPKNRWLFM